LIGCHYFQRLDTNRSGGSKNHNLAHAPILWNTEVR
jgi:hypothetical protein